MGLRKKKSHQKYSNISLVPCRPCPGFNTNDYSVDFTKISSLPDQWILADAATVKFGANGAEFTFAKRDDAPYIWTSPYIFFGKVDVVMKAAPGTGIISSAVLLSDDLDEVDWEFSGNNFAQGSGHVQTNYFGKGIYGNWDRGTLPAVADPTADFHTYTLDWSPTRLIWSVDGNTIRTLQASDCDQSTHQFPQTPSRLHLGVWDGGDSDNAGATIFWAGGYTDLTKVPYTMYVKSVRIQNMNPGPFYNWTDKTGSANSVKVVSSSGQSPSSNTKVSAASATSATPVDYTGCTAPTATQSPVATDCNHWYKHSTADEGCYDIAKSHNIQLSDLYKWNPQIGTDCGNLWLNYYVCVGVGEIPSCTSTASTSTTTVSATPGSSLTCPSANNTNFKATDGSAYIVECFYDRPNGDITSLSAPSFESCINQCSTTAGCINIVFAPPSGSASSGTCWLKNTLNQGSTNQNRWGTRKQSTATASNAFSTTATSASSSGAASASVCPGSDKTVVSASSNSGKYTVECGIDHPNGDITSKTVSSFQACVDLCDTTSVCVYSAFYPSTGVCWLKKQLNPSATNPKVWGAIKASATQPSGIGGSSVTATGTSTDSSVKAASAGSSTASSSSTTSASVISTGIPKCPGSNNTQVLASSSPDAGRYTIECAYDRPMGDMLQQTEPSFQACILLCETTAGCLAASFYPDGGACWIKNILKPGNSTEHVWTARKSGSGTSTPQSYHRMRRAMRHMRRHWTRTH